MAAETARQFEALEAQARVLMAAFIKAGHEAVAPAMIQPAGVYLDVIGEELRGRTYVFTDPDGAELCLRPDLTVPTCRLHIERGGAASGTARYCYNGAAFRFQPHGGDATHLREFRQAGIESFGDADREGAEARTLALVVEALRAAGLEDFTLRLGDLGLFDALIARIDMPDRWRHRLRHAFWRRHTFRAEVQRLARGPGGVAKAVPPGLMKAIAAKPDEAERLVLEHLEAQSTPPVGARTPAEIAAVLADIAADTVARPLPRASAALIESYAAISGPAPRVAGDIARLMREAKIDLGPALASFEKRLSFIAAAGIDLGRATFSAEFGRHLHYYTGLVFEISAPALGVKSPIAGGGRYDNLMRAVGGPDCPAVGAAIHTERLLAAVAKPRDQSVNGRVP
jgi:ATP phosphoribosyltransferase regulatory subunit